MALTEEDAVRLAAAQLMARTAQHLLNTPLTLALGYADLLAEDPHLSAESRAWAQAVGAGVHEAAALLERLLQVNRLVEQAPNGLSAPILDVDRSVAPAERRQLD
jgi:signal transduction histidine kinase